MEAISTIKSQSAVRFLPVGEFSKSESRESCRCCKARLEAATPVPIHGMQAHLEMQKHPPPA